MSNLIRILISVVLGIFLGLASGKGCGSAYVHPSGHATYVTTDVCSISTDVDLIEFKELAQWCVVQHEKRK